jgi:hypothetical protein
MQGKKRTRKSGPDDWNSMDTVLDPVGEFVGPGGLRLDPCSNPHSKVCAREVWDLARGEDGLVRSWTGRSPVYCNAPYGDLLTWGKKVVAEAGQGVEILMLVPATPDTEWFDILWRDASAVCFWHGRLRFTSKGRPCGTPRFGSALFYFGPHAGRFEKVFAAFGNVVVFTRGVGLLTAMRTVSRRFTSAVWTALRALRHPPGAHLAAVPEHENPRLKQGKTGRNGKRKQSRSRGANVASACSGKATSAELQGGTASLTGRE